MECTAEQEGSVGELDSLTTDAKPLQQPQIKRQIKKEAGHSALRQPASRQQWQNKCATDN